MKPKPTIHFSRVGLSDAQAFLDLQIKSFAPVLEKYQDYDTSPANESIEKIIKRISQPYSDLYFISHNDQVVGGIRIIWSPEDTSCKVSPVFILPEHQGKGIGQAAMIDVEKLYPKAKLWMLSTISEEAGLCKFYEVLGYTKISIVATPTEKLSLAFYEKKIE